MTELRHQHVRLATDVMARPVGKELFILNVRNERYFGLDEVGARMFSLLTQGASVGEALGQLETEYAVDPETLCRDIEGLIQELARYELIQVVATLEP